MPKLSKPKIIAAGLFVIAAIARIPAFDGASAYANNERIRDLNVLIRLHQGILPLIGPVSTYGGFHFGPAYYYLYYLFGWIFGFRAYALAAGSCFFSLAALLAGTYLCFLYTRNKRVALVYMTLTAFSAFDMLFASYGSNPNALPLFAIFFFLSLHKLRSPNGAAWYAALLGLSFGIATQLHIVACIVLLVILVYNIRHMQLDFQKAVLFLGVFFATYVPYAYFEFKNGFPDLRGLLYLAAGANTYAYKEPWIDRVAQCIATALAFVVNITHLFSVVLLGKGFWFIYILTAMITGLFFIWRYEFRLPENLETVKPVIVAKTDLIDISLWVSLPFMAVLIPVGRIQFIPIYYFTLLIPAVYISLSICFEKFYRKRFKNFVVSALICYIVLQVIQIIMYKIAYR